MLAEAGRAGALTVAITNNPTSPLAELADLQHRDLGLRAVPASPTTCRPSTASSWSWTCSTCWSPSRTSTGRAPSSPPRRRAVSSHRRPRRHASGPTLGPRRVRMSDASTVRRAGRRLRRPGASRGWISSPRWRRPAVWTRPSTCSPRRSRPGAVVQAFGTGHSEAFAMEIAGRAGGLIPTNKIALRDLVLRGSLALDALGGSTLERDPAIVAELWDRLADPSRRRLRDRLELRGQRLDRRPRPAGQGERAPGDRRDLAGAHHGGPAQAPERSAALRRRRRRDRQPGPVRRRHPGPGRRRAGRLGLLDHQRLHRPAAHHRRGRADRGDRRASRRSTCPPTSPAATSTTPSSNRSTRAGSGAAPSRPTRPATPRTTPIPVTRRPGGTSHEHHRPAAAAARLPPRLPRARGPDPDRGRWRPAPPPAPAPTPGGPVRPPAGPVSDTNPFGMAANSTVDAVIFNGGYGIAYAEFAGEAGREAADRVAPSRSPRRPTSPRPCSRASSPATRRT